LDEVAKCYIRTYKECFLISHGVIDKAQKSAMVVSGETEPDRMRTS